MQRNSEFASAQGELAGQGEAHPDGHAKQEEVESGKVEKDDKAGNDVSDKLATEGTMLHGVGKVALAAHLFPRNWYPILSVPVSPKHRGQ